MLKKYFLRMILTAFCLLTLLTLFIGGISAESDAPYRVESLKIMTGDSVGLVTDIYVPEGNRKYPAILIRGPYGSKGFKWLGDGLASNGYAVVVQNVRGTGGSGGNFFPFVYDKGDGMATVDWILDQPWCDGNIGLWGSSYLGFAAYEIASTGHPAVKSIFDISSWSDLEPFMAHGGAMHLMAHLRWFFTYASGQPAPPQEAWDGIFRTVPLSQFFQGAEELAESSAEPYPFESIKAPILHITGWYDYIYVNVLDTYESVASASENPPLQHLIIGPWAHNDVLNNVTKVAEVEFGENAKAGMEWAVDMTRRWYDYTIKGTENDFASTKPVRAFIMGDNDWIESEKWPPEGVEFEKWYIDSRGKANGSGGDGILAKSKPSLAEHDSFIYDPINPVPTVGGANSNFFPENLGPKNQAEVEKRNDVLVYTSEILTGDLIIAGPIKAVVYASTEGQDTDFTAKLTVVREDGYVRNIEDGIVRGRYLFPNPDSNNYLKPGEVYKFEISLGASALRIKKGERLRVEISGGNFPKYDRNPNDGEDPMSATQFMAVRQTVYHNEQYPSHIIIPVLHK